MAGTQNVAYFRKPTSLGEWAPDLSLPASLPGLKLMAARPNAAATGG